MGIGTPEDALRSCLKLFSRLFEVPEAEVRGYLDMYFQLRLRVEESKGTEEFFAEYMKCDPLLRRFYGFEQTEKPDGDGVQMAPSSAVNDEAAAEPETKPEPEPQRTANNPETPESSDTDDGRKIAASSAEDETAEQDGGVTEDKGKKSRRGAPKGNKSAANAAAFKRTVRERLLEARKNGLTNPQLLKESAFLLTEDELWRVVHGHVVGIATYRTLDEALQHFEN